MPFRVPPLAHFPLSRIVNAGVDHIVPLDRWTSTSWDPLEEWTAEKAPGISVFRVPGGRRRCWRVGEESRRTGGPPTTAQRPRGMLGAVVEQIKGVDGHVGPRQPSWRRCTRRGFPEAKGRLCGLSLHLEGEPAKFDESNTTKSTQKAGDKPPSRSTGSPPSRGRPSHLDQSLQVQRSKRR